MLQREYNFTPSLPKSALFTAIAATKLSFLSPLGKTTYRGMVVCRYSGKYLRDWSRNVKDLKKQCVEIGRMVEFHRKKSGLTQAEAAKLAGIGKTTVYDIEHGKLTTQLDTLLKLLSILNIRANFEGPLMQAYRTWKK